MGHMHDKKERIAMLDIKKEYSLAYRFKTDRSYENYWKEQSELYDICIWGMGNLGKIICQWFQDNEIPIKYFCDNENEKHGETFQGVKCVSYERIAEFKDGLYVIIAVEMHRLVMLLMSKLRISQGYTIIRWEYQRICFKYLMLIKNDLKYGIKKVMIC